MHRSLSVTGLAFAVLSAWTGCGGASPEAAPPPAAASEPPAAAPSSSGASTQAAAPPEDKPSGGAPAATAGAGSGAAPASAEVESKELTGGIDQNQVRELLVKHGELFNDCYTIGAGKADQFVATVTIRATVGPKGNVTDAKVVKSTAKNPKVDTCVTDAIKKIPFPKPKNAAASIVTFPMEFKGSVEKK